MQSEPKRYRHKKRGTTYQALHTGRLQVDGDLDNERVTVYRCEQDGGIWVRPDYEFNDGRFEEIPALASPSPISADAVVEACVDHIWPIALEKLRSDPKVSAHVSGWLADHIHDAIASAIRALKGTRPAVGGWRTMDSAPTGDEIIEVSRYPDYARWNASRFLRTHADHLTLFRWRHPAAPSTQEADHDNG